MENMFSWNGCYSASSYVEAVSTRVNSEMAILAPQRILMLWPVQNTYVDKHSGINLELIWKQSGINLEYEYYNLVVVCFAISQFTLVSGMAGGGKGSLQFAVCHKSVGLWHLRLPRAHCAVGMAKIYMVITNDICLPLPDLALSYYVPSRHVNLPIKHIWIPQIIPQKRSNSRKFGQNSTHSSTVINIYTVLHYLSGEK